MRKRVIFVNRFFYPDESATSQILSDLAPYLVDNGWDVRVVTSRTSYADPSRWWPKSEVWCGVEIVRVQTTRFGRGNILGRTIDYLSFYLSSFFATLALVRAGDCLVAKTDPPLLSVPLGLVARLKRAVFVNWLQDLFPEVAAQSGFKIATGPIGQFLTWLRNRSLRRARMNVVIGERMKDRLLRQDVPSEKIEILPNFANDEDLQPNFAGADSLREAWGFQTSDTLIEYSGNLGRAHDYQTVVDAAKILSDSPEIKFLFVGGGYQTDQLKQKASELGLNSFHFRPYQPRSELVKSLGVGDLHWMSLNPELEGLIVPSKFYGIAAVGKPIVMIGDPLGEIGQLVSKYECGIVVAPGDSETLASDLRELSKDRKRLKTMGESSRKFIDDVGGRRFVLSRWNQLMNRLAQ